MYLGRYVLATFFEPLTSDSIVARDSLYTHCMVPVPVPVLVALAQPGKLLDMDEMTASAAHQMCVCHAGSGDGHDGQERRPFELLGPVEDGRRGVAQELERVLPGRFDGREGASAACLDLLRGEC